MTSIDEADFELFKAMLKRWWPTTPRDDDSSARGLFAFTELTLDLTFADNAGVIANDLVGQTGERHISISSEGTTTWFSLTGTLEPDKLAKLGCAIVNLEMSASPNFRITAILRVVADGRNIDAAAQSFIVRGQSYRHTLVFEASQEQLDSIQSECLAQVIFFLPIAPLDIRLRSIWGLPALER